MRKLLREYLLKENKGSSIFSSIKGLFKSSTKTQIDIDSYKDSFFLYLIVDNGEEVNFTTLEPYNYIDIKLPTIDSRKFKINGINISLYEIKECVESFFKEHLNTNKNEYTDIKKFYIDNFKNIIKKETLKACVEEYINFIKGADLIFPFLSKNLDTLLKMFNMKFNDFLLVFFEFRDDNYQEKLDLLNEHDFLPFVKDKSGVENFWKFNGLTKFRIKIKNDDVLIVNDADILLILKSYDNYYQSEFNLNRGWSPLVLVRVSVLVTKGIEGFSEERVNELIVLSESFNESKILNIPNYSYHIIK